jgi:hypothetical protein
MIAIMRPRAHVLFALGLSACTADGFFVCSDASHCGPDGLCEEGGACSFPDPGCATGRRYGEHGDPALRGLCVPAPADTGSTGDPATSGTPTPDTTSAEDTLAVDEGTSTAAITSVTTGAESSDTGSIGTTTGDVDSDTATTGAPATGFFDDFERPDADAIGNGWWEKTPAAFQLVAGEVVRTGATTGYPDNLVLRPAAEIQQDVEITLVFRSLMAPPGNPQIHARVQEADFDVADSVTGYILFVNNRSQLIITRQEAATFATAFSEPVSPLLVLGDRYRLRFVLAGADPVQLDGYLEAEGPGGTWMPHTEVHVTDADPTRIATPGYLGFSGNTEQEHFTYDDFGWTEL